ncbi:GntR family transcriptional regulator [Cellulomonas bogoriensis]|uniref:GntR family transcriptional regulator n=1 Tax=Cellulomonas bogoriensis 69B4 = DSM 16987 TaxID=1386082 RepID=A0A0A0BL84_9CELL|nr:GntR family transcriptional regulator [Cellulomonas bogoriensis]KGM09253.1 GntR family transcriptional regulator [Cellulomonas bogoriensis 69B4 = DSM 16987]
MIVHVEPDSPVPVFEQLRTQITRLITSGALPPGTTLPPIRHLATDLGLARGTVNKVYDALARDGLVRTAGRRGTVVLGSRAPVTPSPGALDGVADALALAARQLGLADDDAHRALAAALDRLGPGPAAQGPTST